MKSSYKTIIVDDEQYALDYLIDLLAHEPMFSIIGTARSAGEAITILKDNDPDILFLDIQMPDGDGFSVVNALKDKINIPKIVFVTAFEDFAIQAIKHEAFDYILKPAKPEDIQSLIQHLSQKEQEKDIARRLDNILSRLSKNKKICFPTRTGFVVIDNMDIVCCKADHNYTEIFLDSGNKKVVVTVNLSEIQKLLPDDIFLRISRSFLINMTFVSSFERTKRQCTLSKNDQALKINIPYNRLKEVEKILTSFIDKN